MNEREDALLAAAELVGREGSAELFPMRWVEDENGVMVGFDEKDRPVMWMNRDDFHALLKAWEKS